MQTYTYSVVNDGTFPNHKVDIPRFMQEIAASTAITVALDDINVVGENCEIVFRDVLPQDELLALEQLVFAHSGAPLTTDRTVVVPQPFAVSGRNINVSGHRKDCAAGQATDLNISWAVDCEIQGVVIEHKGGIDGDYITGGVYHPLNPASALVDFGKAYIKPGARVITLEAESAKTIPAGVILRFTYHSTNAVDGAVMYVDIVNWR